MTVLLVILTFAAFILLDLALTRREAARQVPARARVPAPAAAEPVWVAGYQLPEDRHYHRGHTWARALDGDQMVVGMDGREASLVSPVEGEVVEVNESLRREPRLATDDPYGRGWFVKLRAGDTARELRNLLSGSLARRFMEDAREGLDLRIMALSGSVLQDGGEPVADFARHLSDEEWRRLVSDLLLT